VVTGLSENYIATLCL